MGGAGKQTEKGQAPNSPPRLNTRRLDVTSTLVRFVLENRAEVEEAWKLRWSRIPPLLLKRIKAFEATLDFYLKDYENHMQDIIMMLTDLAALRIIINQWQILEMSNLPVWRDDEPF